MTVGIILVNYQDYADKYLVDCYESLMAQSYQNFTLYIVDNESTPETKNVIANIAPSAKIIPTSSNLGFGGGNNVGIKQALADGVRYVVALNMDTTLDNDWLMELVDTANTDQGVQIIQSKILISNKDEIDTIGNTIHYLGFGYCSDYGKRDGPNLKPTKIDYVSGCSMLIKKEVFDKIGFFNDRFFMYQDDLEFCWRARLAGFNVDLSPKSVCHHKYDFKSTEKQLYFYERNRLITLFELLDFKTLLLLTPSLIGFQFFMSIFYITSGKAAIIKDLTLFFFNTKNIKWMRQERKMAQSLRTLKDRDLVKTFAGKIEFQEIDNPILRYFANPLMQINWFITRNLILW